MKPASVEGYNLLHQGALALSQVEANGIRIDLPYLDRRIVKTGKRIAHLEREFHSKKEWREWQKRFGSKANLDSREQLATTLIGMGVEWPEDAFTETEIQGRVKRRPVADEKILSSLDLPFVKDYLWIQKLKKAKGTYLEGIRRETVTDIDGDSRYGLLHPVFNLHLARTYRSSSDHINFQNLPVRNSDLGEMIRRCFIGRGQLLEVDYGGIEVRWAAVYNKDPVLIEYIKDPTKDMHRDMAAQCYKLRPEQVSKQARYCAKNMFVFPQFYGDFYISCAKALWEAMERMSLTVEGSGVPLREHLAAKGIRERGKCDPKSKPKAGTFEKHIQEVEEDFWGRRFKVYAEWKRRWFKKYQAAGGFHTLTGFTVQGVYSRNDVVNYPIQGSAFHCLLWSLIQVQRWLVRNKMRTKIVGQIHDSIVLDTHTPEIPEVLAKLKQVMTLDVRDHWPCINVPLEIEAELSPLGGSWFDKERVAA